MIKRFKSLIFSICCSLFTLSVFAQVKPEAMGSDVDKAMRSNDKIYVVMAVCLTILMVLFLYLVRIDRKVSRKEKML